MITSVLLLSALLCTVIGEDNPKKKYEDPLLALDRHLTKTLAYHYLWPWNQLMKAAAALELEENLEEPSVETDPNTFEIRMIVRNFKLEDLEIRVKNRYIVVEGKRKVADKNKQFMTNHFVQSFMLPPGTIPEEVTAYFDDRGVLSIRAPKHDVPPPVDIRVPIIYKPRSENADKKETVTTTELTTEINVTKESPILNLDLAEDTARHGKIKKKELKPTPKTAKDNEVGKEKKVNTLEYTMIEGEE